MTLNVAFWNLRDTIHLGSAWVEHHLGLAAWMQAFGTVLAVFATYRTTRGQLQRSTTTSARAAMENLQSALDDAEVNQTRALQSKDDVIDAARSLRIDLQVIRSILNGMDISLLPSSTSVAAAIELSVWTQKSLAMLDAALRADAVSSPSRGGAEAESSVDEMERLRAEVSAIKTSGREVLEFARGSLGLHRRRRQSMPASEARRF